MNMAADQPPPHAGPTLLDAALAFHDHGCCVVPARTDGSKAPAVTWRAYMRERPPREQVAAWAAGAYDGIGLVCGAVSSNLGMLELEGRAVKDGMVATLAALMAADGLADLWGRLSAGYVEHTPSGGIHWLYRVTDGPEHPNTKLARRLDTTTGEIQVLAETRGEGGFVVVAPSAGRTHPTGLPWRLLAGGPATIPALTGEERDLLHAVARRLDTMPPAEASVPAVADRDDSLPPGEDYNQRGSWDELLGRHGWTKVRRLGPGWAWRRPGKQAGISATTGQRDDADRLYVFTTSTPFEAERPYSKFSALATLEHGGDYSAAARALRREHYGAPRQEGGSLASLVAAGATVPPPAGEHQGEGEQSSDGAHSPSDEVAAQESRMLALEVAEQRRRRDARRVLDAAEREQLLADEVARLQLRDEAQRHARAARDGAQEPPPLVGLADFLAVADEPTRYRLDGLWPIGGRVVLAAQAKTGKSTLVGNLVRSLADGDDFLDTYDVAIPEGRVILVDNELDPRTLRRWIRDQGIQNADKIDILSLRGRVSTFDLLDPVVRAGWARQLAERKAEVVIFDCLRPVIDALGLSEDKDAGRVLVAFDALLYDAGASEGFVVHHMGHSGERSRGDTRIRDWPDVEWKLLRERGEDGDEAAPEAARFLSAYGRDVDVPESELRFDPATRRLSFVGGSRETARAKDAVPAVLALLEDNPQGLSRSAVEARLRDSDHVRKAIRGAVAILEKQGRISAIPVRGGALLKFAAPFGELLPPRSSPGNFAADLAAGNSRSERVTPLTSPTSPYSAVLAGEVPSEPAGSLSKERARPRGRDGAERALAPCISCGIDVDLIITRGELKHPTCPDPQEATP